MSLFVLLCWISKTKLKWDLCQTNVISCHLYVLRSVKCPQELLFEYVLSLSAPLSVPATRTGNGLACPRAFLWTFFSLLTLLFGTLYVSWFTSSAVQQSPCPGVGWLTRVVGSNKKVFSCPKSFHHRTFKWYEKYNSEPRYLIHHIVFPKIEE